MVKASANESETIQYDIFKIHISNCTVELQKLSNTVGQLDHFENESTTIAYDIGSKI